MLRYAISNLNAPVAGGRLETSAARRAQWLLDLEHWAAQGVDFVQLREKALDAGELFALALEGSRLLARIAAPGEGGPSSRPKLLINSRPDVAVAAGADGVHLTSRPGELTPEQVRAVFRASGTPGPAVSGPFISVSCHTPGEVDAARRSGADLILFGPVFEKRVRGTQVAEGIGIPALQEACASAAPVPVVALGGATFDNVSACLKAGAAGSAGIRLFAQDATGRQSQPAMRK